MRFKNQGLDSIEVQDNGLGISPDNYETIALKHYTSKLSTYSDLATLQTFGFRGEALSSLCALSKFSIVTCLAKDVPKGTRLDFESSGKLKETHVVAAQGGTNVIIENLFHNLPVRRRELQRNIKREWNKVIALLNQYACIQTGVKFSVSQQPTKGRRIVLFSTKGNITTRENLVNIFGAKTMTVLVKLDMTLEFEPTTGPGLKSAVNDKQASTEVRVQGYVSRPAHGEGRQTPDRQMFFVNGRPCGLPQFAKVFNEVYRAYNASQSPFILADIQLDTHLYDVNVSPDKRTILLHDQTRMLENLREALVSLFQSQDYSIPAAQVPMQKAQLVMEARVAESDNSVSANEHSREMTSVVRRVNNPIHDNGASSDDDNDCPHSRDKPIPSTRAAKLRKLTSAELQSQSLISRWVGRRADVSNVQHEEQDGSLGQAQPTEIMSGDPAVHLTSVTSTSEDEISDNASNCPAEEPDTHSEVAPETPRKVADFNARLAEADGEKSFNSSTKNSPRALRNDKCNEQAPIPVITPIRTPRYGNHTPTTTTRLHQRSALEVATITIGTNTTPNSFETPPQRAEVGSDSALMTTAAKPLLSSPSVNTSFGSRLTEMFSATQSSEQKRGPRAGAEVLSRASLPADMDSDGSESNERCLAKNAPSDASVEDAGNEKEFAASSDRVNEPSSSSTAINIELPGTNENATQTGTNGDGVNGDPLGQASVTDNRSHVLKGGMKRKDATLQHRHNVKLDEMDLQPSIKSWVEELERVTPQRNQPTRTPCIESEDAEDVLSLIISKSDFAKMTIVGQFNLGFIIAVRHAPKDQHGEATGDDELFIIDQHASDEKYNFERLQSTTVVQSQRLVHPKQLELTALEEEIVMENIAALDVNGFKVHVDGSGVQPVGSRCKILALPLSRETTFTLSDLEELIALLGDHHLTETSSAPRPSKVRAMFAMRACRSSVMIGKALAQRQMEKLVRHMGELDKPWNCPHGRPTMRHLSGLGPWDAIGWKESEPRVDWAKYAQN